MPQVTNSLTRQPHVSPGDFTRMQGARAAAFLEFKKLALLERDFDEDEQAEYDRLLAEVQDLDRRCREWHHIVPAKSGRF